MDINNLRANIRNISSKKKYSLRNKGIFNNIKTKGINDIDISGKNIFLDELGEKYNTFKNVLENNINTEDLSNFRFNSNRVKKSDNKRLLRYTPSIINKNSFYDPVTNSIFLGKNVHDYDVYRELLHMASTSKDDDYLYTGFNRKEILFPYDEGIASGINEGYSNLLTKRYLKEYCEDKIPFGYEMNIAIYIEAIVGQKKMTSLFLNSNLEDLIKELSKYNSEYNTLEFINDTDYIHENMYIVSKNIQKRILENKMRDVNNYLIDTFSNKVVSLYNKGKISDDNRVINSLDRFITSLPTEVTFKNVDDVKFNILDKEYLYMKRDEAISKLNHKVMVRK